MAAKRKAAPKKAASKHPLRDRTESIRKQRKLDLREPDAREGEPPVSSEGMAPLVGIFTSRGKKFALEYEGHNRYSICPLGHEDGVIRNLPPIGLIAASSLMCAFEDAVKAVPPKMVTAPSPDYADVQARINEVVRNREEMVQLRASLMELRRTIDSLMRVALDQDRD